MIGKCINIIIIILDTAPHHHGVDGISTTENLLELGSQPLMENGFPGNFWSMPAMLTNQPPQGTS